MGDLRLSVAGDVVGPEDDGFDAARRCFNALVDRRPAVIVRCLGAEDIATAFDFARANRLDVAVRGGGHNPAGHCVVEGGLVIDPGADRDELRRRLLAIPGVGPWTVAYVELRALGNPDVFLATDLGVRRALERRGLPGDPRSATTLAEPWRPWRSYALLHLWTGFGAE
jgi:hypothetical protein